MNTPNTASLIRTNLLGLASVAGQPSALTAKQIAELIGKSESVVRETLAKMDGITKSDTKPALFSVPAPVEAPAKQKATRKQSPDAGRGNPTADTKKINLNPQSTLNRKKADAEAVGGSLSFQKGSKLWAVTFADGEQTEISAVQLAGFSYEEFKQFVIDGEPLADDEDEDEGDDE